MNLTKQDLKGEAQEDLAHNNGFLRLGLTVMAYWFVPLLLVLFLSIITSTKNTDLGLFDDSEGKRSIYYRL